MKTTTERIEEIVNEYSCTEEILDVQILTTALEALVLQAKLEQLRETK